MIGAHPSAPSERRAYLKAHLRVCRDPLRSCAMHAGSADVYTGKWLSAVFPGLLKNEYLVLNK